MKEKMKKASDVIKTIFGYGIMIDLFAGGATFFAYLVALIVGGDAAAAICNWVYNAFIPVIIYSSTVLILVGLLAIYMAGEKALVPGKKGKEHEGER